VDSIVRNIIKLFAGPLAILYVLFGLSLLFGLIGVVKIALVFFILALFWLTIISTPFIPEFFLKTLENKFNYLKDPKKEIKEKLSNEIHLHVLGSGDSNDKRLSFSAQLHVSSTFRLNEAIRLHLLLPNSKIILTGNSGSSNKSQAEFHSLALQELGVKKEDISIIPKGWNTHNESVAYFEKFGTKHFHIIITDAVHMPRAVMIFTTTGLNPLPAPTNFRLRQNNYKRHLTDYLPSSHYIMYSEIVMHAWIGVLWAKLRGYA